jgi:hypothetical protein
MKYLPINIRREFLFLMPLNVSNMTAGSDDINMNFLRVSDSKPVMFTEFHCEKFVFVM